MDEKELKKRTKDFAHRCVKLALALPKTQLGRHKTIFNFQYSIFNLKGCYWQGREGDLRIADFRFRIGE